MPLSLQAATKGTLTAPAPGSHFSGSSAIFTWATGSGVGQFQLWIGTAGIGSGNLGVITRPATRAKTESVTIRSLPTNGSRIYVRLFSWMGGTTWGVADYTYTAAKPAAKNRQPAAALRAFSCRSTALTGSGTDACTIALSAVAPAGGTRVSLSSNNAAVALPASVTVPPWSSTISFSATVHAVPSPETVVLRAVAGNVSKVCSVALGPAKATLLLSASRLSFGNVALKTPATQPLVLTSSGTAPLTIRSANLTGRGFRISGAHFPLTLNPQQTATLDVEFTPATGGIVSGTLIVTSNDSSAPTRTVAVSGTGESQALEVSLRWDAPDAGNSLVGYHIYRAPRGSMSFRLLTPAPDTSTSYEDKKVQAGDSYDYIVESVSRHGVESAPSNIFSVTVQ